MVGANFSVSKRMLRLLIMIISLIVILVGIVKYKDSLMIQGSNVLPQYMLPDSMRGSTSDPANGLKDTSKDTEDEEVKDLAKYKTLFDQLNTPLIKDSDKLSKEKRDELIKERAKLYIDTLKKPIIEPKVKNLVRADDPEAGTAKATILSLVRNEDIKDIKSAILQMENTFNRKFNYPYTFLNDNEFTEDFKNQIREILPEDRIIRFGTIDPEVWNMPESIDRETYVNATRKLGSEGVGYADRESYHNMCRFYSRSFYKHPLLKDIKYTWRLEPGISLHCDIDYDVFKFMEKNNKLYGYTINVYDSAASVRTLWPRTMKFLKKHPEFINPNGAFKMLKENGQKPENFDVANGYSTCHFWTNFEITDLDFLRSEPYQKYMDFLESQDGFYYERWGDAPVRSVALSLFADKKQIHWFRDIGYYHQPYINCPGSPVGNNRCHNKCSPGKVTPWSDLDIENCQAVWIKYIMTEDELNMY
ncbi:hypothetical protein Kpol_1048p62 [Vanderwaltozyma polyspora DSM 70294]|uniref:Mannosyltransferase KTR4 n=1 Tax=Vanderwaltozyma polyspora (strain ATCC 22028 / DSM 70294 / BCRC 21397 / CBS 2163 / NBRC 10782 / NRRL Y-8283 / UCD 57-17) TaxID=436907 RepID=A7TGM4_VANPO|nr:uncharacterized protein Kpol_1048p62 [Vanderwaltozyma polyspora DSM 70294]EDO18631.1 hypothetical protein Kpol_1048p62 [Vanderwaltozyma polyspora DSM 70294]